MASGAQSPPRPAAWDEVRADPRPGGRPGERTEEMALRLLLPAPPWNVSLPPATQSRSPEACPPGAARLPEPSARRCPRLAARTPRAAGPAADATPAPPPPSLGPERRRVPCDLEGLLDERRMAAHLKLALSREARLWRGGRPQQVQFVDTFQEVVLQLLWLENIFHFSQGTFNLALTIFHRLLVSVKVKERLLHCVTITSLRLAAKVNEEEEVCTPGSPLWAAFELIPRIKDFIKHYGSGYTSNELLRMELAILDKLHWDLYIGTPLDFLTIVSPRSFQSLH
ncbi:cyclin-I2 [Rhinolophus ferrumequinum]|uniref:cyclin-I2 n=1 Tax=Rhinolophus ferrumequinum TaxID=59479 RepID=UPI00140F9F57|nr:cyclin-I2 [Rhinolophus ferrumequinum]